MVPVLKQVILIFPVSHVELFRGHWKSKGTDNSTQMSQDLFEIGLLVRYLYFYSSELNVMEVELSMNVYWYQTMAYSGIQNF